MPPTNLSTNQQGKTPQKVTGTEHIPELVQYVTAWEQYVEERSGEEAPAPTFRRQKPPAPVVGIFKEDMKETDDHMRWADQLKGFGNLWPKSDEARDAKLQQQGVYNQKRDQFLKAIKYDADLRAKCREQILNTKLTAAEQDCMKALHFSQILHEEWFCSNISRALCINGRDKTTTSGAPAVSWPSAFYTQFISAGLSYLVLNWYCRALPDLTAKDMVVSFIGQFLSNSELDFSAELASAGANPGVNALVKLLRSCIEKQVKKEYVFCIIDCITQYESNGRDKDMKAVLNGLMDTVIQTAGEPCKFKLLVTDPKSGGHLRLFGTSGAILTMDLPPIARKRVEGSGGEHDVGGSKKKKPVGGSGVRKHPGDSSGNLPEHHVGGYHGSMS